MKMFELRLALRFHFGRNIKGNCLQLANLKNVSKRSEHLVKSTRAKINAARQLLDQNQNYVAKPNSAYPSHNLI